MLAFAPEIPTKTLQKKGWCPWEGSEIFRRGCSGTPSVVEACAKSKGRRGTEVTSFNG